MNGKKPNQTSATHWNEAVDKWCIENDYMLVKDDMALRNEAIISLCISGRLKRSRVAELFNLSSDRVNQIYRSHRMNKSDVKI